MKVMVHVEIYIFLFHCPMQLDEKSIRFRFIRIYAFFKIRGCCQEIALFFFLILLGKEMNHATQVEKMKLTKGCKNQKV